MTTKIYGSLDNRIMEGKNYKETKELQVGDDITMYLWSDRECYFITEVIDQKHIKVKKYEVVASRDNGEPTGMGHQDWKYFKTHKEAVEYINKTDKTHQSEWNYKEERENKEEEWAFRYGNWKKVVRQNKWTGETFDKPQYRNLSGKVSFGIRDYHYDWEF